MANFTQLAQDTDLRDAIDHTLIFAGGSLAISCSLGLLLALLLDQPRRLPGLLLAFFGQFKSDWAGLMAASVVMSIPAILLFALVQRFLVGGLAAGAVRG